MSDSYIARRREMSDLHNQCTAAFPEANELTVENLESLKGRLKTINELQAAIAGINKELDK